MIKVKLKGIDLLKNEMVKAKVYTDGELLELINSGEGKNMSCPTLDTIKKLKSVKVSTAQRVAKALNVEYSKLFEVV